MQTGIQVVKKLQCRYTHFSENFRYSGGFKLLAHASVVPNVPREAYDSEVFFGVGDSAGAGPPAPWSIQPG